MLKTILAQLWKKNLVLNVLVLLCLPMIALCVVAPQTIGASPLVLYILFILLFTSFDCYGFSLTQDRDNEWSELRIIYRVIQDMFEVILLLWIFSAGGWKPVIASLTAHWLTTCDKLFYILRREPDYGGEYTWLSGWSIFLILKYVGIRPTTTKIFNTVALIGFVAGIIICFL